MIAPGYPCPNCSVRPDIDCEHRPADPEWRKVPPPEKTKMLRPPEFLDTNSAVDSAPIVAEIETFLNCTGMSGNSFGRAALSDEGAYHRWRKGVRAMPHMAARARQFMEGYQA